jgi:polyhydroxyalkanoate synthesis regulator phasin
MRQDAWRAYLEMALGITEASRKKAVKVAKKLVGTGEMTAEQLQGMADDLVKTSAANRDALAKLVRSELERALSRMGVARADEVTALTARVRRLEAQLAGSRSAAEGAGGAAFPAEADDSAAVEGIRAATSPARSTGSESPAPDAGPAVAGESMAAMPAAPVATEPVPTTAATPKKTIVKKAVKKAAGGNGDTAGDAAVAAGDAVTTKRTAKATADAAETRSKAAKEARRKPGAADERTS